MITLEDDRLVFRAPNVHPRACLKVSLERTLRVPDDGKEYPLPPSFGRFPLQHVSDFSDALGSDAAKRGGVMLPIHPGEAAWLGFSADGSYPEPEYPFAVKIAAGKINAITGAPWTPELRDDPQDYITVPSQRWIDGFAVGEGVIRQFVAEQLGHGATVEEQLTGRAEFGGIQIVAYPMKSERFEALVDASRREARIIQLLGEWEPRFLQDDEEARLLRKARQILKQLRRALNTSTYIDCEAVASELADISARIQRMRLIDGAIDYAINLGPLYYSLASEAPLGVGAGGLIRQTIYPDENGLDAWDQSAGSRCFITLIPSEEWCGLTGKSSPTRPPTARDYASAGLPWFDEYKPSKGALKGSDLLASVKSLAKFGSKAPPLSSTPANVVQLGDDVRPGSIVSQPEGEEQ